MSEWDQALLLVSDFPSNVILEGLYKSKLQNSAQSQTCTIKKLLGTMDSRIFHD